MAFLLDLMSGSLWRASCPPPSGPLLRNVQIRSRRICPGWESVHRQTSNKTKGSVGRLGLLFYLMSGSSLLSHGETPHYHRRYGVSLMLKTAGRPVTRGITLGLKDILNAREVLLLVTGEGKQDATERFLTAKVSTAIPASFLWLHSNFICLINT